MNDEIERLKAERDHWKANHDALAEVVQSGTVKLPFTHSGAKIMRKGHASRLLGSLAKWMRREGVGDYQTLELVASYIDAIESATPQPAPAAQPSSESSAVALLQEMRKNLATEKSAFWQERINAVLTQPAPAAQPLEVPDEWPKAFQEWYQNLLDKTPESLWPTWAAAEARLAEPEAPAPAAETQSKGNDATLPCDGGKVTQPVDQVMLDALKALVVAFEKQQGAWPFPNDAKDAAVVAIAAAEAQLAPVVALTPEDQDRLASEQDQYPPQPAPATQQAQPEQSNLDFVLVRRSVVKDTLTCLNTPENAGLRLVLRDLYAVVNAPANPPAAQQDNLAGCACRWDADDNRVVTCPRHQGWLDVIQEWADRAKAAEAPAVLAGGGGGWQASYSGGNHGVMPAHPTRIIIGGDGDGTGAAQWSPFGGSAAVPVAPAEAEQSMKADRELLKLAAKAARNPPGTSNSGAGLLMANDLYWSPLTDDGDEARLEARLGLSARWSGSGVLVTQGVEFGHFEYFHWHNGDKQAARRRAGVTVAADIGESL